MKTNCKLCGEIIELPMKLEEGQHVLCPCCGGKFAYASSSLNRGKSSVARIKLPEKNNCDNKKFLYSEKQAPIRIALPQRKIRNAKKRGSGYGRIFEEIVRCVAVIKNEGFKEWYKNLSRTKKCVLIAFGLFFVICLLGNLCGRGKETLAEKEQREWSEALAKINHYVCSEKISVDLCASLNDTGVFGLKWGEMPRNASYRLPCSVDYPISHGLYSRMTLFYPENYGLSMITLHAPQRIEVPDFNDAPKYMRAELRQDFVTKACVPIFDVMIQYAELILHQRMRCILGGIQLTGLTDDTLEGFGVVKMDIHGPGIGPVDGENKEPERSFVIIRHVKNNGVEK